MVISDDLSDHTLSQIQGYFSKVAKKVEDAAVLKFTNFNEIVTRLPLYPEVAWLTTKNFKQKSGYFQYILSEGRVGLKSTLLHECEPLQISPLRVINMHQWEKEHLHTRATNCGSENCTCVCKTPFVCKIDESAEQSSTMFSLDENQSLVVNAVPVLEEKTISNPNMIITCLIKKMMDYYKNLAHTLSGKDRIMVSIVKSQLKKAYQFH